MPVTLRRIVNERLELGNIRTYEQFEAALEDCGWRIVKAPAAGAGGLEQRLELLKLATRQARQVMRGAKRDGGSMSDALLRLVQQHLFAVLVEFEPGGAAGVKLESIARTVAQLTRASLMNRKYAEEHEARMAERAAAAEAQLTALLNQGAGQREDKIETIRRVLLEMVQAA